jgi:hypothetical protein
MHEVCRDCGKTWGVTMPPREDVRCSDCVRPKPWRNPVDYWGSRWWNYFSSHPHHWHRSPEWWDQQTDRQELTYAAELARHLQP